MKAATPSKKVGLRRWRLRDQRLAGQGLVEYAMIIALLVIVIVAVLTFVGQVVFVNLYSKIGSNIGSVMGG